MSTLLAPGTHTIIIDLARACPNSSTTSINLYQHELGYGTVLQDLEAELRRHCMMVTAQAAASTDAPLPAGKFLIAQLLAQSIACSAY